MRIVSFDDGWATRGGLVIDDVVFDLEAVLANYAAEPEHRASSVRTFLELYGADLATISAAVPALAASHPEARVGSIDEVRLTAPLPDPSKVLCIGLNYRDHVAETGRALPEYPDVFAKFATTLIGPADEIAGAAISERLDFEGELAIVIGRTARDVDESHALEYIAGVAPLNDITARDLQYRGTQWLAGKAVDGSTPWGPAIVTLDEIGDPQALDITTRVNGVEMQHSNTRHQIFGVTRVVAYLSSFLTLEPGDIVATGTPHGIGAKRTPPVWLHPGDEVEIEIERVGVLRNRVAG